MSDTQREPTEVEKLVASLYAAQLGGVTRGEIDCLHDDAIDVLGRQYGSPDTLDNCGDEVGGVLQLLVMMALHRGLVL